MEKKYIVIGGRVTSQNDGEKHYINANRLCVLYRVNPDECYLIESSEPHWELRLKGLPNLLELTPKYDGNYHLK